MSSFLGGKTRDAQPNGKDQKQDGREDGERERVRKGGKIKAKSAVKWSHPRTENGGEIEASHA